MKFIYVQLSYQQDLISCAHLVVSHPSSAPQSFPCRLPSYSVPKTVLVQPLVLIKNSNMPFSTFFTSSLPTRSSGRAAISLLVLLLSGAHAQDRTTEAGEAQIKDPNVECSAYSYPPVSSRISSFPPIWQIASILPSDTNAQSKWAGIQPNVPNIPTKGTPTGNFTNFTLTYSPTDPDCWWTYHQCTTPKLQGLPSDIASVPEPLTMGYGFDDGPNCSHNAFYDFLMSQNQKATLFYIGSNVLDWPLEAQRGVADGHEICVHTWSHRYMTALTSDVAFAELYYTMQAIKLVIGITPTCWRPPFGDVDDRIRAIAKGLGLRTILWGFDSYDWKANVPGLNITQNDVDNNYQNLITRATNGSFNTGGGIFLTHEINNYTMTEAIKEYPALKAAFQHMVPIGVALNITQPYVESNYTQPTFQQYISGNVGTSITGGDSGSSSTTGSNAKPSGQNANQSSGGTILFIPIGAAVLSTIIGIISMS